MDKCQLDETTCLLKALKKIVASSSMIQYDVDHLEIKLDWIPEGVKVYDKDTRKEYKTNDILYVPIYYYTILDGEFTIFNFRKEEIEKTPLGDIIDDEDELSDEGKKDIFISIIEEIDKDIFSEASNLEYRLEQTWDFMNQSDFVESALKATEELLQKYNVPYKLAHRPYSNSQYITIKALDEDEENFKIRISNHKQVAGGGFVGDGTGEGYRAGSADIDMYYDDYLNSKLNVEEYVNSNLNAKCGDKYKVKASALKSIKLIDKTDLLKVAQKEYDEWDASDEEEGDNEVGFGGICHLIAEAMVDVLVSHGYDAITVDSQGVGDQHVWCVVKAEEGCYEVDIPPSVYETGGGYNWKKKDGIKFTPSDLVVHRLSSDPEDFSQYNEE
jgi:hypothetical protein